MLSALLLLQNKQGVGSELQRSIILLVLFWYALSPGSLIHGMPGPCLATDVTLAQDAGL